MTTITETIVNVINDYSFFSPLKIDRRRASVKKAEAAGLSHNDIIMMRMKHISRRNSKSKKNYINTIDRITFLKIVKTCKFDINAQSSRYNCTGIDWKAFHRPSSNGKGWVIIAPDEPANNWYLEDALILNYLTKKYMVK